MRSDAVSPDGRIGLTPASSVRPEPVEWVFNERIATGSLTLLVGEPGRGKSTLLTELVARLTRGELPGDFIGHPVTCLMASAEDSLASTLVPRLTVAGAELTRVKFVTATDHGVPDMLTLPDDGEELAARAAESQASLIAIDPLVAFLPSTVNAHRDQDVRRALAPLHRLAEETGLAVVAVMHLNKQDTVSVLGRVGGSVAFTAAARSVLVLAADPDERDGPSRILAQAKSNLGPIAASLECRLETGYVRDTGAVIEASRLLVTGTRDVVADDLLHTRGDDGPPQARDEAADFIQQELANGPVRAKEMLERSRSVGLADKTVKRAKADLKVGSVKQSDGTWMWKLPIDTPEERDAVKGATPGAADNHGPLGPLPVRERFKGSNEGKESEGANRATLRAVDPVGDDTDWTPEAAADFISRAKAMFPGAYEDAA